jgi:hypothetical protein
MTDLNDAVAKQELRYMGSEEVLSAHAVRVREYRLVVRVLLWLNRKPMAIV